jgi:hypothetical protein
MLLACHSQNRVFLQVPNAAKPKTMCFWHFSKSKVAPRGPGPKRLQNEPFYIKEFKSETHRPKFQNASFRKRAFPASGNEAEASK